MGLTYFTLHWLQCHGNGAPPPEMPTSCKASSGPPGHLTAGLRPSNWLQVTLVTIYMSQDPPRGSRWPGQAEMWGETGLVGLSQRQGLETAPQWALTSRTFHPLLPGALHGREAEKQRGVNTAKMITGWSLDPEIK